MQKLVYRALSKYSAILQKELQNLKILVFYRGIYNLITQMDTQNQLTVRFWGTRQQPSALKSLFSVPSLH